MTKTKNTTAFDAFIADLDKLQDSATKAEHGMADTAAHLTRAIVDAGKGGNYPQIEGSATVKGKAIAVHVTPDHMVKFAQGKLTQDEVSAMIEVVAGLAPKVAAARAAYAELSKLKSTERALYAAEIAAAKTKAHSVTQTLRRPLRMAAFLIASPEWQAETAEARVSKGSRIVFAAFQKCGKDGKPLSHDGKAVPVKVRSVTTKNVDDGLKAIATKAGNPPATRAPQASKANTTAPAAPAAPVAAISDETFRRGRKKALAETMERISHGVADMSDGFNAAEREDAITLVLTLIDKLDADGKAAIKKALAA